MIGAGFEAFISVASYTIIFFFRKKGPIYLKFPLSVNPFRRYTDFRESYATFTLFISGGQRRKKMSQPGGWIKGSKCLKVALYALGVGSFLSL